MAVVLVLVAALLTFLVILFTEDRFPDVAQEILDPAQQTTTALALFLVPALSGFLTATDVDGDTSGVWASHSRHHRTAQSAPHRPETETRGAERRGVVLRKIDVDVHFVVSLRGVFWIKPHAV